MTILKRLLDVAPSHVAGACVCKNLVSVSGACNYTGTGVLERACGCKEDTVMVLGACGHDKNTVGDGCISA